MERILEPELMEDKEQVLAYARADFSEPTALFLRLFKQRIGEASGQVLELGCGPGTISMRFAGENPHCMIYALDGSRAMLEEAQRQMEAEPAAKGRVVLIHNELAQASLPQRYYPTIISNSLLHHLHEPMQLWNAVKMYASSNAWIFMMDLMRPSSEGEARRIVERYCADGPEILKRDFYNSLLASFEPDEIKAQLRSTGLDHFTAETVSDIHVLVYGRM
jgi:SAM-dependent methyltransferase